jgi:hypothetical protein
MMADKTFEEDIEDFEELVKNKETTKEVRDQTIFHTEKQRQYIVKVPGEFMQQVTYQKGDILRFTLTTSVNENDESISDLKVEYVRAKDKKNA